MTCLSCSPTDSFICIQCGSGYFLKSGLCYSCAQKWNCAICDATADKRNTCMPGYLPWGDGCRCGPNTDCSLCPLSGGYCNKCVGGYFKPYPDSICQSCFANCAECVDGTSCIQCTTEHFLPNCLSCSASFNVFSNALNCTTCADGFYLPSCAACIANCKTCSDSSNCLTFKDGF